MVEAGLVSSGSVVNILFKNLGDTMVTVVAWFVLGYALAHGSNGTAFAGNSGYLLHDVSPCQLASCFFQFSMASTAATIVRVAGRPIPPQWRVNSVSFGSPHAHPMGRTCR